MAFYLRSLFVALALCAVTHKSTGQLNITGNEQPLIIGLSRDILCIWNGASNVTTMEWFVVGLEAVAVETATNTRAVILTLEPDSDGLDGAMFTCKATLADGRVIEETITLVVEEIENTVTITSSTTTPTAGQRFILTCTVSSERPAEVTWIDPNGMPCPLNSTDMSVSSTRSGQISTLVLTLNSIHTSQSGRYKCISNIVEPPSKSEASFLVRVQIPEPTVTILREPEHPEQLFTTNSLILTCVIELIPEVDSFVAIRSQWRGHSSLTDSERRVIVSDLEGSRLMYNTSVTFNSLKSSDSGLYVCSAIVSPPPESRNLNESSLREESIDISVVLKVTIDVAYNPPSDFTLPSPPYYRPATSVTLTCRAYNATGSVSYRWSSTCSSCFASSSTSQSVSETILKSNSAGVHTCTATDSVRNSGISHTEMKLIGAGIYVANSYYIANTPIANNTMIVGGSCSSSSCNYVVYCFSNSTSSNVGYYVFPDGTRKNSNNYYDHHISRESVSGIRIYSNAYYSHYYGGRNIPRMWGIFTCELPDSEGHTVETSIGIYSSRPSAPSVYSSSYSDLSNTEGSLLGTLECLTQNSPPTTVTWLRDGVPVHVDGERYEMKQTATERQSYSRYKTILLIRDAAELAGSHTYSCTITNAAGSTSQSIKTTLIAQPVTDISLSGEPLHLKPFNMTCRASLNPKVASQLIHFLVLDWVLADGHQEDGVIIKQQWIFSNTTTRSLVFNPLNMTHGGDYKCEAKLILPDSAGSFNTSAQYHLSVLDETIIQLKFGPMVYCAKWYEDKRIGEHLERDIKRTLVGVINENCSCDFKKSQIDQGEFSCQTAQDKVTYRARLTGNSDTLTPPELLAVIQDWVANDGTFLYTYHGRIRLRLDFHCPVEIASFSKPECTA